MRERPLVTQPDATPNADRASGSSFYMAMRILPQAQRDAMFAIYGFCRQVDDIADARGPRDKRLAELAAWRTEIMALYGGSLTSRTRDLAKPVQDYGLDRADFLAIIDGMEMDVIADVRAPTWPDLDLYCDRVASAVGRLSVNIFGLEHKSGRQLAHHLGRALQLTNILRDLDEDAAVGRPGRGKHRCRRSVRRSGKPGARPRLCAGHKGGTPPFRHRR